jgi:hypothetical protein
VKIGDLVKYDKSLSGLENCMGLIIGLDGQAFVVEWMDRHAHPRHRPHPSYTERSVELPEFLEVLSTT